MNGATDASFLGEPRRLHPLTLLLAVVRLGPRSLNFLPALIALGVTGQARYIVPALAMFILISLVFSWLAWTRFTWTVDTDDVSISSGIVSRQQRVIPFDRIQDVSIEQGLVQRLLGLAKVGFETGSSGGDKKDEAKLDAIALDEAEALRRHIRARRGNAPAPAATVAADVAEPAAAQDDGEGRTIFAMSVPRLVVAGIFNFSLAIFAVLFGALSQLDDLLPFDPFDFDLYVDLARSLGLEQWVLAHRWLSFVGGGIAVLLLGALTGIIRTVIRDYGFTLDRTERGFRRRRGLTTRTDVTIPAARVQAAMLSTGFIRRRFGWYDLKLQSLGGDGKDESDHLVAPLAKLGEADAIFAELGLDRADLEEGGASADWHRSHRLAMLFAPSVTLAIAALLFAFIAFLPDSLLAEIDLPFDPRMIPLAPAAGAVVVLVFGWLDWRHRRWHFDGRLLHIADGFLSRRHIILPARNIQSADLAVGPVARRFALADLELGVPGGKAGQHHVSAISEVEARALRAALLAAR